MNTENLYPVCTILYKTDNSGGWHYAIMSGSEKECTKECEKLKKQNGWHDYKCYVSFEYTVKHNYSFQNYKPSAEHIYMCTDLIYNDDDGKWYYHEESMPYPKREKNISEEFHIDVKGEGEVNDENYWIPEPKYKDDFEEGAEVLIDFGLKDAKILTKADDNIEYIKGFISRLQENKYSNMDFGLELSYSIFLAWEKGENVRFMIKDYSGDEPASVFDNLIPKDLFYKEFQNLIKKLEFYINKHKDVCDKFHEQEKWLDSLKWQYDEDLPYIPWEYSLIKWNKKDTDKLEKFADMIYQTAEPHEILKDEPLERFTCRLIGDYYYAVSEKDGWDCICRTYFHSYKLKDILRFMKSSEFNYKKGMSLKDIYNQLTDKGYNIAVECKYHGKEIEIYANGQADSKTAGKDETKELKQLIIKLTKNIKDKENLTVSELADILGDHIDSISYRDGKMKIRDSVE
ncbi:MAG: hypothetical protein J5706_09035 [Elusimicrobiales bacterium]|nr:hypothetical protein [Elusimicrobiales bacterium]